MISIWVCKIWNFFVGCIVKEKKVSKVIRWNERNKIGNKVILVIKLMDKNMVLE